MLDLNAVVREMDDLLRRLVRGDIELAYDLDPGLGAVEVDPGQIEQVIMNLVVNAVDAAVGACPATDQRGVARPLGAGCDVGSVEQG